MPTPDHKPGQLTAMISSTALDLPSHRAAVKEACIDAGVFPVGMEHLPARDVSGIRVSLEMVDKADIYLGIYAWRYGWEPDFDNPQKISITEMEFDRAVERKVAGRLREILIFTAHDDHPCTRKDIETGDEPQRKLTAFKAKAGAGRVRKEFKSVEELRRLVSEAIHHFLHREKEVGDTGAGGDTARTSIPHNLPRLSIFFGREDELKKIADALDPESCTWGALIDGPGGMGKTSLAVRAAYDASPDDFRKIIFISLKTRELDDDGVRDLSVFILSGLVEMLNELARALGCVDIAKAPEDQRPRLLLDALCGTQTLLVFDNLESLIKRERDILFTFVQKLPAGCKAILTSRGRIGFGAEELILERLSQEAALATLTELATRTRNPLLAQTSEAERVALYRETSGKPLLLRWMAGQLGRGSCRTFADALHFLRNCPPNNDPLEFIFGDLVEEFTREETRVLCGLTHFTVPATAGHITEVAGIETAPASTALWSLANRSLVVPNQERSAFAVVPMVAEFLRRKRPEVVVETGNRLESRAYELIIENGYQKRNRFPILDAAWPTVAAALPLFLAGGNDRLQKVCAALNHFLSDTGRWDERLSLTQQAEARAVDSGDMCSAGWRAYKRAEFTISADRGTEC